MKLNNKNITLIALLSALVTLFSYVLIMPFVFLMIILSSDKKTALLTALLSSLLIYIVWGFMPHTLLNFIVLPLMAIIMEHFCKGKDLRDSRQRLEVTGIAFVLLLLTNILNTLVSGLIIGNVLGIVLQYLVPNLIGALINAILIFVIGQPVQKLLIQLHHKLA